MDTASDTVATFERFMRALGAALGYRDLQTRLHSERVSLLAEELAIASGLDSTDLQILRIAASFHDIGKIGVPDVVLAKTTPLDDDDWQRIRRHPVIGEEIIRALGLHDADLAATAVRHHHEDFAGGGYPDGLAGDAIPIAARIVSIADSYDAMAVRRAYHAPRAHLEIMSVLDDESGRRYDPYLMSKFHTLIERSPHRARDA